MRQRIRCRGELVGITSTAATIMSTKVLEESAIDRKEQLDTMNALLRTMVTHLYAITDEEVNEYDQWDL